MRLTIDKVYLGQAHGRVFDQGARSWAIILPGAGYSAQAPLLWYSRRAALAAGRNVLVVTDAFDRETDDPVRWVEERVQATFDHVRGQDSHPLLIAKSMSSLAAPFAAQERLPGVWLTPLIDADGTTIENQVLVGLRAGTAPRLLVGGSDDPTWSARVASTLSNAEVLELPGADHSLEVPEDVAASLANLRTVTEAVGRFLAELRSS